MSSPQKLKTRLLHGLLALLLAALPAAAARAQAPVNYADWRLEWAEEFNTPLDTADLAQRWRFHFPWGRAPAYPLEIGYYTGRQLQTSRGALTLTNRRLATPVQDQGRSLRYSTEMLFSRRPPPDSLRPVGCPTAEGFSYGLFEVRARQPRLPASGPAFWLFGGVPDEIDVFEAVNDAFTNNFHLAPGGYWRPTRTRELSHSCLFYNVDPAGNLHEQFHTYAVSWLPNGVIFYFDGVPIRHETRLIPGGCAMNVILNIAAFNWAAHDADTLAIDYIRIYRPRRLPPTVPTWKPGAAGPLSELVWLPFETTPGRPDQATHQTWRLAPAPRQPRRLDLQLTDNYNPPDSWLPLPVAGHWAPPVAYTDGRPELRVEIPAPDSVRWAVHDLHGRAVARGTAPGGGTWRPGWAALPPGAYVLHLRQGPAVRAHRLLVVDRPRGSQPDAVWPLPGALPAK